MDRIVSVAGAKTENYKGSSWCTARVRFENAPERTIELRLRAEDCTPVPDPAIILLRNDPSHRSTREHFILVHASQESLDERRSHWSK